MTDKNALIRVEGLCKSFGSLEVLKGIDTEIHKGEVKTPIHTEIRMIKYTLIVILGYFL